MGPRGAGLRSGAERSLLIDTGATEDGGASIARLNTWIREKPVSHVLGTHIEMTAEANVDYPMGTTYQPDERPLPLAPSDILKLHETLMSLEVPERTDLGSFIIWPVDRR
ncbi:hypothetical protein E3V39_01300 [Gammaproteobacteria bacterium LSUCC0112]|nr:hypothetical protein E3V39_01300 [Gammaproteobacteria bacterium LSUCC0112]